MFIKNQFAVIGIFLRFSLFVINFHRFRIMCLAMCQLWYNPGKILMEQSKEIKQNLTGPNNFDICFCVIFGCYDCSFFFFFFFFFFFKEIVHQALSPPNFEVFIIFPSFLRSLYLIRSTTSIPVLTQRLL